MMSYIDQFQHLKIQLEAIQSATNNFSADNCIGQGGFGRVYKGELVRSTGKSMVALKRLDTAFGQGNSEFWKEIMTLSFYKHENIVSLLGYCDDHGEKILVYEYASKKSLDSYLATDDLTWVQRLKICVGAARGLAYLHTPATTQLRIVHRDIKSANILLDNNWNAKISDFGLSKFAPANTLFTFVVSNPVGTHGYIDPLYAETGLLTKESDVYSFGVVLFEVLCGRLCFGNENLRPLIGLVREYYLQNKIIEVVFSNIKDGINKSSLRLFAEIAYRCLKREREERPLMTEIVSQLEGALYIQENANAKAAVQGAGILNVKGLGTTYARSENPFDASNHYLVLYIDHYDPLQNKITTAKYNDGAEQNEEFTLYVKNVDTQSLSVVVNAIISVEKHHQLGAATFKLTDLTPGMQRTCTLPGYFKVEVLYKPTNIDNPLGSVQKAPIGTPKDGGLLIIIIHGAYLLSEKDDAHSSVSLFFCGETRKTQSMMNAKYPMWLQEFTYMLEQPPTDENLHFEVINNESMGSLGSVDISLADVVNEKWTNQLYKVERGYGVDNHLQVELQWRTSD